MAEQTTVTVPAQRQPSAPPTTAATEATPRAPVVLPWITLAITLWLVLRSLGALLAQVQISGASAGQIESLASGVSLNFVDSTRALLQTWHDAIASHELILWTARAYTAVDVVFIFVYVTLLIQSWRRLRSHQPSVLPGVPVNLSVLQRLAHARLAWILVALAAVADAAENGLRLSMVERTIADLTVSDALIIGSWVATTLKVALIGTFVALLVVLLRDSTLLRTWLRRTLWAIWRLRAPLIATAVFVAALLGDATGQTVDLSRRWVDDWTAMAGGLLAIVGSLLLGLTVWLIARRVVLADQSGVPDKEVRWWAWLLGVAAVSAVLAFWLDLNELYAVPALALVILVLGFFWGLRANRTDRQAIARAAAENREKDARPPDSANVLAARRVVRILAIASPVTLLMLGVVAFAPVPLVLLLNDEGLSGIAIRSWIIIWVALVGAPLTAFFGYRLLTRWDGATAERPATVEVKYRYAAAVVGVLAILSIVGAITHLALVSVFLVVPVFLATLMLLLGEAQRWSERHTAPPGLLLVGFTRLPVVTLVIADLLVASFWLNDGSANAVRRDGPLPNGIVAADGTRAGLDLTKAFGEWVLANCAGGGHEGQDVPLVLVAAPGGGLRAAYWTASTLSDLFDPSRSAKVAGCDAAPSDRIFAMGGASGGSLGLVAYAAGLDAASGRDANWYDEELGRPDLLTDPLTWMVTTDLARAFVGFGGQDRAQRLEDSWTRHIGGLRQDFFAGSWGLGGRRPVMMLTGTQVESGCRLNVSAMRLTDAVAQAEGGGCTAIRAGAGVTDAPVTSDLLDFLCGPNDSTNPASLSNASAALLSARFPYVSPSGQLYGCATDPEKATRTAIVDGGYAENTGIGMLLALWPRLERLIATHNATSGNARVVPVFLMVDNHYAEVAAAASPQRVVEALVPPLTRSRPDSLDELAIQEEAAATFSGPVPGTLNPCDVSLAAGRYVSISPQTSPGLPAPLAWTLSRLATEDLTAQRRAVLGMPAAQALRAWAQSTVTCQ